MQLSSEQLLPVSQAIAWQALNDIEILKISIPGCESISPTAQDEYEVALTTAIGPVKAKFKGKMRLSQIDPPNAYVINFEGQGGAAGHGKGEAQVRLEAVSASETRLVYSASAQVGGKIAQIGSRLVDMAAQKMATDFFSAFNAHLAERYAAATPAPAVLDEAPPAASLWARLVARLKALFGT